MGDIIVCCMKTGKTLYMIPVHSAYISNIYPLNNGSYVGTFGDDNLIKISSINK